ncbi:MAG: hypothetical protein DCO96_09030 [Fluviicola sp. XM-24bin1]|nr:MAG: hypothetical protein DCO96_09030 [Fluviicola sp. XM-24bin1]
MKTKLLFTLLLLGVLSACSLNGKQEASLNAARMSYIEARNTNNVPLLVKLTYADAVRYYQEKGDDVFKERFRPENNQAFFRNGTLLEVASKGDLIHVQFEFEKIIEDATTIELKRVKLYAISIDDGKHWKFLDDIEYDNPKIIPKSKKLITSS